MRQVLLQRLNERHLPYALELKARMDKGELLTDYDLEFLEEGSLKKHVAFRRCSSDSRSTSRWQVRCIRWSRKSVAKGIENEKTSTKKR